DGTQCEKKFPFNGETFVFIDYRSSFRLRIFVLGVDSIEIEAVMPGGGGGALKSLKPKIQSVDIQAAAGWGIAAAAGAIWVVQPFDWIKKTFIDKPAAEEN
uniref:Uncharacterized protein n=5 Tax=Brassica TaxID=3705 RepID=A0A0D3B641_BRAOL